MKCNAPADAVQLKRALYWHPPWVFIMLLINIIVFAIVALATRKRATVHFSLCGVHRANRRRNLVVTSVLFGLSLAAIIIGIWLGDGRVALSSLILFLAGIFYSAVSLRLLWPAKIDENYAYLRGAGREFLRGLPSWNAFDRVAPSDPSAIG